MNYQDSLKFPETESCTTVISARLGVDPANCWKLNRISTELDLSTNNEFYSVRYPVHRRSGSFSSP